MAWQTTSETQSKRALSILLYGEKLRTFLDMLNSVSYARANIQLQHWDFHQLGFGKKKTMGTTRVYDCMIDMQHGALLFFRETKS